MTSYGYIRTSKERQDGRAGSDPETQRHDLRMAGVEEHHIYADVAVSGIKGVSSRNGWRALESRLKSDDFLIVAALDRIGRHYGEMVEVLHRLRKRGVRIRSLSGNEGEWVALLDSAPDPDSIEAFLGDQFTSFLAFAASEERKSISTRTKKGLEVAKTKGRYPGRPRRLNDKQVAAFQMDLDGGKSLLAISRDSGVPAPTLRRYLVRRPQEQNPAPGPQIA